jgi:ligand-binding SRPBCC domain-containing protein
MNISQISLIVHVEFVTEIKAPVSALREFHFQQGAIQKLTPPWENVTVLEAPFPLRDGVRAVMLTSIGPFKIRWVAIHQLTAQGFVDRQEEGPFAKWTHEHRFEEVSGNRCRLTDAIDYELPFGWVGRFFGGALVRRKLERMFHYRHEVTRGELEEG